MPPLYLDLLQRGKDTDVMTDYVTQLITSLPSLAILMGGNDQSLGLRVLRTDQQGRLLVSNASQNFDIINKILPDAAITIVGGSPAFRRVVFYAQNANANLSFQKADGTLTAEITVVPNTPLTIEGIFTSVLGRNTTPAVVSTIQAVVNYDPMAGQ